MGIAATLLFLLAVCAYGLYKLVRAERRAAAANAAAVAEKEKRLEQEKELLDRLGRIREKKDELQLAKNAIQNDPGRAAKVVANMMRKKD
jgi:flagellar biosynthesis/type III secretory pathway M-ring protein FliF/YscJ